MLTLRGYRHTGYLHTDGLHWRFIDLPPVLIDLPPVTQHDQFNNLPSSGQGIERVDYAAFLEQVREESEERERRERETERCGRVRCDVSQQMYRHT